MAEHVHAPPRVARLDPAPPRWIHGMLQDAWHWCKPWHWFRIHGIGASPRVVGLAPAPPSRVTRTNGIGSDYTKPYVGIPEGRVAAEHVLAPPRVARLDAAPPSRVIMIDNSSLAWPKGAFCPAWPSGQGGKLQQLPPRVARLDPV